MYDILFISHMTEDIQVIFLVCISGPVYIYIQNHIKGVYAVRHFNCNTSKHFSENPQGIYIPDRPSVLIMLEIFLIVAASWELIMNYIGAFVYLITRLYTGYYVCLYMYSCYQILIDLDKSFHRI